uniref:NADH dehydrogenase subunit 3 n=1 Tax=Calliobdella nodulifera TaxID=3385569 RepID=UPI00207A9216|nr:NADH dehydrogenase subunit 3 [Notostomum cyclostomum]URP31063.1 NADH dehydrogenase subunit 3 [Notostomum cyclostomum]
MYITNFLFLMSIMIPIMVYCISTMIYMKMFSNRMKMTPFECGFDSMNKSRIPFSMRFFLLAVLFIVFDIEIVLITPFPIMLIYNINSMLMITFSFIMLILLIGLIHEWSEGSLEWNN